MRDNPKRFCVYRVSSIQTVEPFHFGVLCETSLLNHSQIRAERDDPRRGRHGSSIRNGGTAVSRRSSCACGSRQEEI